MEKHFTEIISLPEFPLWKKIKHRASGSIFSFSMEITSRCNNNCRHCYISLPANDKEAEKKELSFTQIKKIADAAASLNILWCLITGGEPLIRKDFSKIYLYLKKKGFLLSLFTNACLITNKHIELFKKYPPRDIEITVYGITRKTYERITRKPGSFSAFNNGVKLLLDNGIRVRFKAMAIRSNFHELNKISMYCREHTKDYFRFDPLIHLRFDRNAKRNGEIRKERLSPDDIVKIEKADNERFDSLQKGCNKLICPDFKKNSCNHLFHCGAGEGSFSINSEGILRLCSSLWHKDTIYDLKKGSLKDAIINIPRVRNLRSNRKEFLSRCRRCAIINLCLWCPAHSYLETGELDSPVDYFCEVAHARARMLKEAE